MNVRNNNHRGRSQQVIYLGETSIPSMWLDLFFPPSQSIGNSKHVSWDLESLSDPKLTQSSRVVKIIGESTMKESIFGRVDSLR